MLKFLCVLGFVCLGVLTINTIFSQALPIAQSYKTASAMLPTNAASAEILDDDIGFLRHLRNSDLDVEYTGTPPPVCFTCVLCVL